MDYKERLRQFNSTEKYKQEMYFLYSLMQAKKHERILDYGCGIGTMVNFLLRNTEASINGHDTRQYELNPPHWFIPSIYFPFDKVYFNHSIAHVDGIENVLENFNDQYLNRGGRIYVITPNKIWLDYKNHGADIKSDESVIKHYSLTDLKILFSDFKIINCGQFGEELQGQNERLFLICEK